MPTMVESTTTSTATSAPRREGGFRRDIEGLRAVAVLLVLAFHAGVPGVTGGFVGVDVFFVISGFLITGLIVREVQSTGRLSLSRFYARRIRRLLPATAVVLAATAALTLLVLPPLRWPSISLDIAASATYIVNWRLAGSVDYLASEDAPSPVQHFWSLAVEEQFYIVWPLLILALVWWQRRSRWPLGKVLMAGLAAIAVPSFVWSVISTHTSPGQAYFATTTRLWELAVGAALAIGAVRLAKLPTSVARALGWLGIVAIVVAAVTFDSATIFPGYTALLPTLGTAAVIAAGMSHSERGVGRVLAVAPLQDIGALSYSLYLWHWPLLVAATAVFGQLTTAQGVLVAGFSVVPAWLSYRIVEYPLHHARPLATYPWRAYALGILATVIGLTAALIPTLSKPTYAVAEDAPGATVLGADPATDPDGRPVDSVASMTPAPLDARDDNPELYELDCHQNQDDSDLLTCPFGDVDSDRVVALVGDSHAAQWQPAIERIAQENGWRLELNTKSACGFFDVDVTAGDGEGGYPSCSEWNDRLVDYLTGPDGPDVVIASTSNTYDVMQEGTELTGDANRAAFVDGLRRSWQSVIDAGVELVVIRDTPRMGIDVPECVSQHLDALRECTVTTDQALKNSGGADDEAAEGAAGVRYVDLTERICPGEACPPVIGNVLVWRDPHHLTATYVRSLTADLERSLGGVLAE